MTVVGWNQNTAVHAGFLSAASVVAPGHGPNSFEVVGNGSQAETVPIGSWGNATSEANRVLRAILATGGEIPGGLGGVLTVREDDGTRDGNPFIRGR